MMKNRIVEIAAFSALVLALVALAITLQSSAMAQEPVPDAPEDFDDIPASLNYQGFLRNPDGSLTTGTYNITARIYNQATEGTLLYETTLPNVTVRDGLFNIVLGEVTGNALAPNPRFIGISLNADPELIPRQRLHAVPWAHYANWAYGLSAPDGDPIDAVVVDDGGNLKIQDGGMCIDDDGSCSSPGDGGMRVGPTGIHGTNTSGSNVYLVPTSGKVGIGISHPISPTAKLDVAGDINVDGDINWSGNLVGGSLGRSQAYQVGGGGTNGGEPWKVEMTPLANSVCFLTQVKPHSNSITWFNCQVQRNNDSQHWDLVAQNYTYVDQELYCAAFCLHW